ncbi:MAG: hypothetical protein ACYTFX_02040, partial [Planctomycetota bacterium]
EHKTTAFICFSISSKTTAAATVWVVVIRPRCQIQRNIRQGLTIRVNNRSFNAANSKNINLSIVVGIISSYMDTPSRQKALRLNFNLRLGFSIADFVLILPNDLRVFKYAVFIRRY